MKSERGEFSIINELFAPLARNAEGAFSLKDDVAQFDEGKIAVTKDLMIEGVHFRKQNPLNLVAQKLLRVNISDLVAKGLRPKGYLLGCVWPTTIKTAQIKKFVEGLAHDQDVFKCSLMGGDTTRHLAKGAPMMFSATFYGAIAQGGVVRRAGAKSGDDIYLSGTIGDSGLGLKVLEKEYKCAAAEKEFLSNRYWLPEPRMVFGSALNSFASAALDVSDGLLADAGHLAENSNVEMVIELPLMPLSGAAEKFVETAADRNSALQFLATCGDDYEILFTAPQAMRRSVAMAAKASRTQITRIGKIRRGNGVTLINETGEEESLADLDKNNGYDHFRD